jgi:hypothetical protein
VFILIACLAPQCLGGDILIGRDWSTLNDVRKLYYVLGVRDGRIGSDVEFAVEGFTAADYIKELDKLFSETENLNIAVVNALEYVSLKLSGSFTKSELEVYLIKLRKPTRSN